MGWALKSSQGRKTKRFTEKQKSYLFSKFCIGETTGKKADATSTAKAMMTARDTDGQRLFSSSEFLTSQQVESYFSRLAAKRALHEQEDIDDVENECQNAADNEEAFSELRSDVLQEVSITHPIYYDCYNLCDLIKNSKLTNFAISVLRKICQHFEIPVADITMRRKAPYIEMIVNFGKNCTCHDEFTGHMNDAGIYHRIPPIGGAGPLAFPAWGKLLADGGFPGITPWRAPRLVGHQANVEC
ncbi:hypothetical protein QZH41_004529 [Actinostola sp. cb2023]|nr:hypothetical protein QZH41_004529 [Actinostola sp. cb2023]